MATGDVEAKTLDTAVEEVFTNILHRQEWPGESKHEWETLHMK